MPIRPENKARYPKDWKTVVVPRIRKRSGNRCECTGQCGLVHEGTWRSNGNRCNVKNKTVGMVQPGGTVSCGVVILTVMHLNHQPEDCRDENLLHGCQGCHLRYDAPRKQAEMKARRKAQRASGDLFQCEEA